MTNPFMQYKQQAITTMTGGELIITLYDEAAKNMSLACKMFEQNNSNAALICTEKSKKIFAHLISILDFNIELSQNLYQLYQFFNQQIITAEVRLNGASINEILPLVQDLKNTWIQAQKLAHQSK